MRTNVLNDLSNVVKKGTSLACSWSQVGRMSEGAPDEHPMSIRSASDGERWKPAGEKGSTRVWKHVAMIFAVLVMSIANIGTAWGAKASWTSPNQSSLPTSLDDGKISLAWSKNSSSSQTSVIYNGGKSSAVARFFSDGSTLTIGTTSSYKIDSIIITIGNKSNSPAGFKTGGVTTGWSAFNTSGTNKYTVATPSAGNSFVITIYKTGGTLTNGRIDITGIDVYYVSAGGATSHSVSAVTSTGTNTYGTVSAAASSVAEGGTTTITAVPASGYRVTNWAVSGTGASISPTGASNSTTTTLTMGTANATVTVTFGAIPTHTITYTNTKSMDNSANPTSYYEGVGVASFTKLRHAVGYDFTGWSPSSINSSATTNQTIDAQWTARAAAAGTGTLTYALAFGSGTITTTSITRNNGALYDATDVSLDHTTFADNANKTGCSGKLTTTSAKSESNYVELTFKIADGYTFTPTEVRVQGIAVSNNKTIEVELTDNAATPNSKSVSGTLTAVNSPTTGGYTVTLDFDASGEITLEGTVTVKIFAYGNTDHWRMGTPFVITGTVASAAPSCTAPSSVGISGEWRYFPGQTISLTATPTGGVGTPAYQWQKEVSADVWENISNGGSISGATSNNLQISSCGTGNTGKYRCIVSTGATCSTNSDPFSVKIFTLNGAYDDGEFSSNNITFTSGTTGTATVHLAAGRVYKFKVTDNFGMWFGNSGRILEPASSWTFPSNNSDNCILFTGPEGDYTFTVDIAHVTYGTPEVVVSVAYPDVTHPSAGYAYFRNVDNWTNVGLYMWYEGGGSYTDWGSEPWVTRTTTICGNTYYYTPLIPSWYNRAIFREVGGSGQTGNIEYANLAAYSGKYNDKSDANWHEFTTYTISFNAGGGEGTMSSITGICPDADQVLPANAFEKTGYTFAGWKDASANEYADEATIEDISDDITLTAQWEVAASLTAISADVLYQAANMANITFTGSDQYWAGLSTNNCFKTYGNGTSNSAKGKTISSTSVTDDISTKSFTSHAYIEGSDVTSGTADPTYGAIEFITPSTAGLLYVYTVDGSSSNLKLRKKGSSTFTALTGSSNYNAIAVDANSNYYIHGNAGKRGLYGIQYVSTYAVTITPTNVTKATGDGTAIKGKAYTATFTANTGYTLPSDVTVSIGGTPATKGTEYTWSVSDGTGTLTVKAANVTGNIVVTVSGVAPSGHTVTYNYNGATGGATPASATGASVTLPTPTRTGYELDGWYTTAGTKVDDGGETYVPEADITLYARWQEACDAGGVAKSTTDVAATGYTTYQEVGGSNVAFTPAPSLGFKYKDADGNIINSSTTAVVRNNAYSCKIQSSSSNKGSIKTNSTFSNVDSISFYFAASDKGGCKIAVWCSTDNFSTDSTSLLSATTYGDSNNEFKLKTLAIPSGKKASALTFKFRFTVTSSGKTSYIDSLKVYSSTSGGGTCYHVYYHGNGAESGYVNDTVSYTAGSKATVLNYNYGRNPLAKAGYDFQGWATSADGAVAYTAGQKIDITSADVDLYAVWATASSALVTWKMKTATDEAWATTTGTGTTDETNITSISTAHDEGDNKAKNSATAKTAMASGEVSSTAAPDKSARFTFTIAGGKQVEINKFDCKVFNVSSGDRTYKAQISDAAGNVYNSTNTVPVTASATLTDASFVFGSGKILRGAVTIRIYAWKTSGSPTEFRMGPDVKFYGTVEDYACATPAAPTISGVSEYVPGQTITLTASHDGANYDNLTTYTWYEGDAWGSKSEVQAAATGAAGYTFTKASCAAGDAGKYWCEVANGTCNAHNSEGYDVTVYPTYTITYNLNGGAWGEVEHKDSYTQFDEDYTLPTPTKTGYVFAGWYGASDFSGLPTVVLGAGSVGNKEYWAKWGASVTVSWTVTKADGELYRGGGGYSVKAVIDQTDWSTGFMDELELTATEGVTLKNIEVSENGESKVQVTADFDITTELAADATSITFTLNVPADGTYGPAEFTEDATLTDCGGGASGYTEFFSMNPNANTCSITNTGAYNAPNHYTTCDCTSSAAITTGGSATFGLYSSGTGTTEKLWEYNDKNGGWKHSIANSWVVLYSTDQFKAGDSIVITNGNNSSSGYYTIVAAASNNTADYHSASQVAAPSTTSPAKNTNYYYKLPVSFVSSNYLVIRSSTSSSCYVGTIKAYHAAASSGVTPTLTWDDGDADIANDGVSKSTSNDDFIYTARQNKNSLGAITYSSSDATVATVNSTTGQVHLVGAAGSATITATIAAFGCYESASVSYTITVTDDCDDEAGTIATEDLGCPGIKMTVTGHTAAAGVSYQWYKVGTPDVTVGSNQDNFTATEAGSYYVIVTNTGDRHCAKRSTNTITVEAKAAATATKIVDSWYVKKDRRTPDVELVKTTGATGFTVKIGSTVIWNSDDSNTTGFAGCGFRMDENGIIYLNGTKDGASGTSDNADAPAHGDETWTAGDVTLTITAIGCGSSASQTITIHKQAATSYYDIAFVADGGKGMKKDSITVGHGDGTELYEYLDSVGTAAGNRLFQLSERNIYWTTDEKAIREEYSQFDAILITDDPSTNTVVKTGDDYKTKGYVNAFGTMVDVRPIFTMEAYVSALKNWGSKGIAGNPESPNPRQYEMRLECKDHEIYGTGLPEPSDGTNVWEETIGGETFRHVILVDSTKGVYKGVAYNAETAGNKKPALQGFTGEAAGSLLGLGRILEGTLQAAIERQEEPAARLLVMGINAKALQPTCALTNEGKTVIKNILIYLLKTNMEEVDDCSNYFTGKNSTSWSDPDNWSKTQLPSSEAKVRILAPCVISGIQPHVLQVSIVNSGNSNIRNTARGSAVCDGTLTIQPDGALIADGKIRSAVAPHFAANDLMPTTPDMLTINTRSTNQAALIFDNEEAETQATVNLYSLGRKEGGVYQFQYFAVPMEYVDVNPAFAGSNILTYVWHENGGWERRGYYTGLSAFEGVGITKKDAGEKTYTMQGNLTSTADREIALTNESSGQNIVGNSWLAPINIASLRTALADDANIVDKTVYIYCTGNDGDAVSSGGSETPGQWLAIPIDASGWPEWLGLKVIPAMQAFCIKANTETTLALNYKDHVRSTAGAQLNEKLRAPKRRTEAESEGIDLIRIRVADSKTHTDLYLFEGEPFSEEFDNGWEAEYMSCDGRSAKLYAETAIGQMAVAAQPEYEGTVLGFAPGKETEYTFTFSGPNKDYYLNDLKLKKSTLISEDESYFFTFEEGDTNRFYISKTRIDAPAITTGTENTGDGVKARKVIVNDKLYIILNGKVYSAEGMMVK